MNCIGADRAVPAGCRRRAGRRRCRGSRRSRPPFSTGPRIVRHGVARGVDAGRRARGWTRCGRCWRAAPSRGCSWAGPSASGRAACMYASSIGARDAERAVGQVAGRAELAQAVDVAGARRARRRRSRRRRAGLAGRADRARVGHAVRPPPTPPGDLGGAAARLIGSPGYRGGDQQHRCWSRRRASGAAAVGAARSADLCRSPHSPVPNPFADRRTQPGTPSVATRTPLATVSRTIITRKRSITSQVVSVAASTDVT